MKPLIKSAFCLILLMTLSLSQAQVNTIAFGSCNKHDEPQPLWQPILENEPQVWVWLGDIIYGDTEDMTIMRKKYNAVRDNKEYQQLMVNSHIIGTWDDHDYGVNDGGKDYPKKDESRKELYDFLDVPVYSPMRQRKGAYSAHIYGDGKEKVKVILLDCRYFRDEISHNKLTGYKPDDNAALLGEEQWEWLKGELKNNEASLTVIGSGIQVISEEHKYEKWGNFPSERKRLFNLIDETSTDNVVFLSGDRHIAEFSQTKTPEGRSIMDVTSSGLTHSWETFKGEPNKHRVGEVMTKLNFGLIKLDWNADDFTVTLELRGEENKLLGSQTLTMNY